jgi:hypothetical protein
MAELYRVYLVDRDDHFFDTVHLSCADDAEAIEQALALAIGYGVELWQLDRKVAVFRIKIRPIKSQPLRDCVGTEYADTAVTAEKHANGT